MNPAAAALSSLVFGVNGVFVLLVGPLVGGVGLLLIGIGRSLGVNGVFLPFVSLSSSARAAPLRVFRRDVTESPALSGTPAPPAPLLRPDY